MGYFMVSSMDISHSLTVVKDSLEAHFRGGLNYKRQFWTSKLVEDNKNSLKQTTVPCGFILVRVCFTLYEGFKHISHFGGRACISNKFVNC